MIQAGMPEDYATMLAGLDTHIRGRREDQVTDTVLRVTGNPPLSMKRMFSKQMMEQHG